jgi:hypothetical protein
LFGHLHYRVEQHTTNKGDRLPLDMSYNLFMSILDITTKNINYLKVHGFINPYGESLAFLHFPCVVG